MRRRICIPIATRGNYSKMKSTLRAVMAHPDMELQLIVAGGIALPRFGDYRRVVEADGFAVAETIPYLLDGDSLESMTMSAALATLEFGRTFSRLNPDIVVVIADRYEALSIAQAALCMNIGIAHLEGGEVSGSIDERIRHAITKLAHIHFPASSEAAERIVRMGEHPASIFTVGTPSLDLLNGLDLTDIAPLVAYQAQRGNGDVIDFAQDYLLVSQHSVVTEYAEAEFQLCETARAVRELGLPVVWILPNMDAGETAGLTATQIIKQAGLPLQVFAGLPMEIYARMMRNAKAMIGNSSSGIREAEFIGVPVVNIGNRQHGRQRGANVLDVAHDCVAIVQAAKQQIAHGLYPSAFIYGDGRSGEKIAEVLANYSVVLDKTIAY